MSEKTVTSLNAVDLFSGGGGLTMGLKMVRFDVKSLPLNWTHMPPLLSKQIIVRQNSLFKIFGFVKGSDILNLIPEQHLDLLSACPPCQGFTSLTAKYKREDPRNLLINEMLRLVEETNPSAIMMENVPGLASRGNHLLSPVIERLKKLGYIVNYGVLQVADFGVPQFRKKACSVGRKRICHPIA
ncbi:DNA cytosine methyltransferase [Escherichia coli]